jgi:hypothetical protein
MICVESGLQFLLESECFESEILVAKEQTRVKVPVENANREHGLCLW